jgi:hypothetical protein
MFGLTIYNYVGYASDVKFQAYQLVVANRTSRRITFNLKGGNIGIVNLSLFINFLDEAGVLVVQKVLNFPSAYYYYITIPVDSGVTKAIKSVQFITNSAFEVSNIRLY